MDPVPDIPMMPSERDCFVSIAKPKRFALDRRVHRLAPSDFFPYRLSIFVKGKHAFKVCLAFHIKTPSLATIYNWFNEFKRGRTNLTDDLRKRRLFGKGREGSSTATTEDIGAVQLMIETDDKPVSIMGGCTMHAGPAPRDVTSASTAADVRPSAPV
ncbi:hypothetical protein EVAR_38319_1 [Eumeta japonica]|uniref:Mos1 transposase HTH domain-containing protein n=1 Tax=Eumeta variegata TaxID=151549 RepID=A0A4C1WAN4_EUMVA|nr:hypothetical protein EVAR_38319_1 [Eumeta japonica]